MGIRDLKIYSNLSIMMLTIVAAFSTKDVMYGHLFTSLSLVSALSFIYQLTNNKENN